MKWSVLLILLPILGCVANSSTPDPVGHTLKVINNSFTEIRVAYALGDGTSGDTLGMALGHLIPKETGCYPLYGAQQYLIISSNSKFMSSRGYFETMLSEPFTPDSTFPDWTITVNGRTDDVASLTVAREACKR